MRLRVPQRFEGDVEACAREVASARERDGGNTEGPERTTKGIRRTRKSPFKDGESVWVRIEQLPKRVIPKGVNPKTFSAMRGPYKIVTVSDDGLTVTIEHVNEPNCSVFTQKDCNLNALNQRSL